MSKWQEEFKAQMREKGINVAEASNNNANIGLANEVQNLNLGGAGDFPSPQQQFNSPRGGYRGRRPRARGGFDSPGFASPRGSPQANYYAQQRGGFTHPGMNNYGAPAYPPPPAQFNFGNPGGFVPQNNYGNQPAYDPQGSMGQGFYQAQPPPGNWRGGYAGPGGGGFPNQPQGDPNFSPNSQEGGGFRGARGGRVYSNISKRFDQVRPLAGFSSNLPEKSPEDVAPPENPMSAEDLALLNKFLQRTVEHMREGTIDVKNQQQDPSSPLHSILNFRELRVKDDIIKALDLMNFEQPSKIQEFALPLLLMEPPTNMIAQSQSGTGKTAAFVLTMLSRVTVESKFPQCICLAPTYELAQQIGKVVMDMAHFMPDVHVHYAVKGNQLERGATITEQIIIGTPGRLEDYIFNFGAFDISKVKCIVLDEADVMISQKGHKEISTKIYNAIQEANPKVQALLFSATFEGEVFTFAEQLIKNAVTVTLRKEEQTLPNIKQFYVECASRDAKYEAIVNLYSGLTIASAIIFCHTKQSATWIANKLCEKGLDVALLHGQLSVEERAISIKNFREGHFKVLITTNVCARGIDVSQVSIVINYDPPIRLVQGPNGVNDVVPDFETYLHRIGRTGRFGKAGIAINLVDSKQTLKYIMEIQEYFEKPIIKLEPSDLQQLEAIENSNRELEDDEDED